MDQPPNIFGWSGPVDQGVERVVAKAISPIIKFYAVLYFWQSTANGLNRIFPTTMISSSTQKLIKKNWDPTG